jgi:hypothetical protein
MKTLSLRLDDDQAEVLRRLAFDRRATQADIIREALAGYLDAATHPGPCEAELHSWDYFRPEQTDSYWMRCTHSRADHDGDHEDSDTGAHWPRTNDALAALNRSNVGGDE